MLNPTALVFAAATLLAPLPFAPAQTPTTDNRMAKSAIAAGEETGTDDPAKDFVDSFNSRSAVMLAVNGHVVAADDQAASAKEWNWTLLLLGCAGLVMTTLPRRPIRRAVISP